MKKAVFLIPLTGAVAAIVAIGATSVKPWRWKDTANKHEINYCLLIGQSDHNDSQARTKGVREALKTRQDNMPEDSNPNTETPKQGKLTFEFEGGRQPETYTVNELEHKICQADSGATWDQSTANNICNTWYSKYQKNITMIVSNNDGMAEGALYASNNPKGMPIFGYDSNKSTLDLMKAGRITGTINSNAPAQAAVLNLLACRILDKKYIYDEKHPEFLHTKLYKGLRIKNKKTQEEYKDSTPSDDSKDYVMKTDEGTSKNKDGYLHDILDETLDFYLEDEAHSLYVSSNIVTKDNVDDFSIDVEQQALKINASESVGRKDKYNIFYNTYSRTDTYLQGTMIPLVKKFRGMYDIEQTNVIDGNGNDDKVVLDAINDAGDKYDAYVVNMTKTEVAEDYIKKIKGAINNEEKFKKTPIIFYNRQPFKNGAIDKQWLDPDTNGGNPYVFYVGFDAQAGATMQGDMILDWLEKQVGGTIQGRKK